MESKGNVNDSKYQKLLSFRVPTGLYTQIMDVAREQGTTLTDAILYAIDKAFNGVGTIKSKVENEEFDAKILELQDEIEQKNKVIEELKENITSQGGVVLSDYIDEDTMAILNLLAAKFEDKVTVSQLIRNYVVRYNIECYTRWFHRFVLSKGDVETATGKKVWKLVEETPKID